MLISTKPDSLGKEAVLFRSQQLTEFAWTPKGDIPVYDKQVGKTKLAAGSPQRGMLYSSTEPNDKFIAENISFESWLAILANPDSALYHKDIHGHNNSWAYFGIVCNGFVRYALGIRRRYSTKRWPEIPGMRKIAGAGEYSAQQIRLCDVLHAHGNGRNHVALITDILRDEAGNICRIEVSEAVRPTCVRKQYDLETYFEKFKLFALWRYDYVDSVPMPDARQHQCLMRGVPEQPVIAVDFGTKANYRTDEEVVISVFAQGESRIRIFRGEAILETVTLEGQGRIARCFDRGYYRVEHLESGENVCFCVTDPDIRHRVEDGRIVITADPRDPESAISHVEFREMRKSDRAKAAGKDHENNTVSYYSDLCAPLSQVAELTEEEKRTGVITKRIPQDAVYYKVYFDNAYGMWTHTMIPI